MNNKKLHNYYFLIFSMDLLNIPINHFKFTIKGRETFKNKNQSKGET